MPSPGAHARKNCSGDGNSFSAQVREPRYSPFNHRYGVAHAVAQILQPEACGDDVATQREIPQQNSHTEQIEGVDPHGQPRKIR
jgi:hypothetical protein